MYEEELREREAALDEAMDARAIRGEALGQDRHFRRYWWYPGKQSTSQLQQTVLEKSFAVKRLIVPKLMSGRHVRQA